MDFLTLAKQRYAERFFDGRSIEQEKLDKILEVGRLSPTARNYQPQKFYIIRSEEGLAKLKTVTRYHYNAPLMIMVCYDTEEAWKNPNDRYYENYDSGEQDAVIAAAGMMFEAEDLGIHTIWVRDYDSRTAAEAFGLPENIRPVMMLGLGYPNERAKPNAWHFQRKPIDEYVTEL